MSDWTFPKELMGGRSRLSTCRLVDFENRCSIPDISLADAPIDSINGPESAIHCNGWGKAER
jgi:hypothetical protein